MMQLHQDYDLFVKKETEIIIVGPENKEKFTSFWAEKGYMFYGIPDAKHSVIKLYGQKVNLFKLGRMPAQMLIDKNGTLRYVHYGHSMTDIPENNEMFKLIDTL
ncbi:hypothetical protein HLPR_15120 [Helicovermis profundi]|uniref:Redoxin domain-containing protein n=1 Tax=Helicovermis profundi TaxID=3065157 RepID=A0AAU9EPB5_9FIRM|nr:hypothetical protein HLPR_15120 [Clostridia bacterium S502]